MKEVFLSRETKARFDGDRRRELTASAAADAKAAEPRATAYTRANDEFMRDHTTQMHALRARLKGEVLKPIIRRATGVSESLGAGRPVFDATDNVNVTGQKLPEMFKSVCADLVTRMGW